MNDPINNTVKTEKDEYPLEPNPELRWYYPQGVNGPKILQQLWIGKYRAEWRDIPMEIE